MWRRRRVIVREDIDAILSVLFDINRALNEIRDALEDEHGREEDEEG